MITSFLHEVMNDKIEENTIKINYLNKQNLHED